MSFYLREFRMGNLQILCRLCNTKKGNRPNPKYIVSTTPGSGSPLGLPTNK